VVIFWVGLAFILVIGVKEDVSKALDEVRDGENRVALSISTENVRGSLICEGAHHSGSGKKERSFRSGSMAELFLFLATMGCTQIPFELHF
jgi:hypothetical protein